MALLPPIVKAVGVLKFVPFIVTKVPTGPVNGLKEVIVGAAANNSPGEIAASNIITVNTKAGKKTCFNDLAGTTPGRSG